MKKLIIFAAFWSILDQGMAQFQHSYGTSTNESGWSLTDLNRDDERYLVAGFTTNQAIDATLIKTDPNGNQIWSRLYGADRQDFFTSVRQSLASSPNYPSYAVAGVTQSFGFGMADGWFVGTDPNGFPMVSHVYGGKDIDRFYNMTPSKPVSAADRPGYVMVGETRSYDWAYPGYNVYVVKTDLYGNLLRATVIGGYGDQKGFWIEQTRDGGYIVVGTTNYPSCSPDLNSDSPTDIFVIRLRPDLTMVWNKIVSFPSNLEPVAGHNNVARCVKETEEGFFITGYTNTFGLEKSYDAFLLALDDAGNFMRFRTYGTACNNEYGMSLAYGIDESGQRSLTVLANQHYPNASYEALMFQTDLGLNLQWARNYGLDGNEFVLELTTDYKSRFAFTGYTTSLGVGALDVYLVETKLNGASGTGCERRVELKEVDHDPCITKSAQQVFVDDSKRIDLDVKEMKYEEGRCPISGQARQSDTPDQEDAQSLFDFYPNPPGAEQLTIQFKADVQPQNLTVYSLEGKKVELNIKKADQGKWLLDTSRLAKGVYVVEVTLPNGNMQKRKLVIE